MDPRGFPTTLPEFQRVFPDDTACARYLEKLRWPDEFACTKCGVLGEPYRFANRPGVLRCRSCKAVRHAVATGDQLSIVFDSWVTGDGAHVSFHYNGLGWNTAIEGKFTKRKKRVRRAPPR